MKTLITPALILSTLFSTAQRQQYQMSIPILNCQKTTESGEDEIYFIIVTRTSSGTTTNIRVPFDGHININDTRHEEKPDPTPTFWRVGPVLDFELADNESIEIICNVMEQDDGTPEQYQSVGDEILAKSRRTRHGIFPSINSDVYKGIIANIASTNHLDNSDDWIGSIAYRISRMGESLHTTFRRIDNPNSSGGLSQVNTGSPSLPAGKKLANGQNNYVSFDLTGDGSKYDVEVAICTQ